MKQRCLILIVSIYLLNLSSKRAFEDMEQILQFLSLIPKDNPGNCRYARNVSLSLRARVC